MKREDLPPHLRPHREKRPPLDQLPIEAPDNDAPPPPPPREKNDRDVDPYLRHGSHPRRD